MKRYGKDIPLHKFFLQTPHEYVKKFGANKSKKYLKSIHELLTQ